MMGMHIHVIPNRGSRPAVLLRESYRDGDKVKKRTLANLSSLSMDQVDSLRRILKGERLVPLESLFEVVASRPHGHVEAVRTAITRLGLAQVISPRPCRERSLVLAMVAARVLAPDSKLATTRWWHTTTLAEEFGASEATEDDLYAAMDWLIDRQGAMEKKLAQRHLTPGGLALYDVTSTYLEGGTCPLGAFGYNRDGKRGKKQVNYGLLTDARGCPVAMSVYPGDTGDAGTLLGELKKVREGFGIGSLVVVGDRGMVGKREVEELARQPGMDWISALKGSQVRKLLGTGAIQLGLFDERGLYEMEHPDYPGERLVVCRNPLVGERRAAVRESLIEATTKELEAVRGRVERGTLVGKDKIGLRVGRVVNRYHVAKHFDLEVGEETFTFRVNAERVAAEAALDGIYVIRTSLPREGMDAAEAVRSYKLLAQVERAFRCWKTLDLEVRPIYHHLERRVRAHLFLCLLAYYVDWHLQEAWRELLFRDEEVGAKKERDPIAPAKRSPSALQKARRRTLPDGSPVESFHTLLANLSTVVRNTCRRGDATGGAPTFTLTTVPSPKQQRALDLVRAIPAVGRNVHAPSA